MADDLESDACAGFKRRVIDTHSSLLQQDLKESSTPIQESMAQVSFFKNTNDHLEFINNLTEENKQLGFADNQESENVKDFGVLVEENDQEDKEYVKLEEGSIVEGDSKESMAAETHVDEVLNDVEKFDGIKLVDGNVLRPIKIQVIDDTALIESVQVPRIGNGCFKDMGIVCTAKTMDRNKKKQQVVDEKKAKDKKMASRMSTGLVLDKYSGTLNNGEQVKVMYSREEMEALRFVNIVQQRRLWRDVYTGLGPALVNEYDNLAGSKHRKQNLKNFDPQMCFSSKAEALGILGKGYSENMENETEYAEDYEADNMNTIDSACICSTEGEACSVLEGECSDEEYASIQRPAFLVEGEPNFDSGPPEDGLEYLRRVRWEAALIPKGKVAKCGGQKLKEQTVYLPQVPDIALCPDLIICCH